MREILGLKKTNCKSCHKCIRNCAVKSIRFTAGQAHIVEDECILCGRCFAVCPQDAKVIASDMEKVRIMLQTGTVYASIAPSFAASYPGVGIDALEDALKKLGFAGAEETAVGATIVKKEYERILDEEKPNILVSSCCSSINLMLRKYYPEALFTLAPVITPMQAHCRDIKRRHPEAKTVFIGPCISKKSEAAEEDAVDAVLMFDEFNRWLREEGIELGRREDIRKGGRARVFPTAGGIIETMDKNPEYTYVAVDGVKKCMDVLDEIKEGRLHNCFIEMSACEGSCADGPILDKMKNTPAQNYLQVVRYAEKEDFAVEKYAKEEIAAVYEPSELEAEQPSEAEIKAMLLKMNKLSKEDELNCGSCGYCTCREKAIAIIQGKAEISMCLPYMLSQMENLSDSVVANFPDAILVLNDELEIQKINPKAKKILRIRDESDVMGEHIGRLLDPEPFEMVMLKKKDLMYEQLYLAEYECYVEQTIIYNREGHQFICILCDITADMALREKKLANQNQAFEIANDMAKKQLKIVQSIASLLGETTADTLIALEHLKETIADD
ncbi:Iron hydrogenase 1 [uncultured Eubacterium sp.]|uniref:[Fe-Fe] hydrogenase large subunit C-terminal domain-containing protein n=1 Tax=Brotomerdimonas butyrica TaxID=2981721 RepID=UPI000821F663|nr:[Fe-Fe] hydrogenase large subunit C-terminal domain-containing protein [Brotomerdimonas butyrica]MCU6756155.1 4Fe-4S binding protein [Brotomerdimonas butyrica]SCH68476.1 Iron hydrogenase 1 [uncultured Eubacterium sp.]